MQEFQLSTEIIASIPVAVAIGFSSGALVVSAVSAFVSGFKALLKMMGR